MTLWMIIASWVLIGVITLLAVWLESRKAPTIETNDDWNE